MNERIEQRVLGALRLTDRVMQRALTRPLHLSSRGAKLVRNSRGYYVVTYANGLKPDTASFQSPPSTPALASRNYRFEITDPCELGELWCDGWKQVGKLDSLAVNKQIQA